nr:GTPase [uncultured Haemophilus sp.]
MQQNNLNDFINKIQNDPELSDVDKAKVLQNAATLRDTKVNILITGATGAGKSSTINALFGMNKAKVGMGSTPETMDIKKFELGNITLWDSPGLGDGKEADNRHSKGISSKLLEKDSNGNLLIDLVLVILDGSSRDLGTSYQLIQSVIIPNLGEDKKRLLIAINQADQAMKGRYWDYDKNEPLPPLVSFLNEKVESTRKRILEATGIDVTPIYYSAGYQDEYDFQKLYNLSKLLAFILRHTKEEKRSVFATEINQTKEMWEHDEDLRKHQNEIRESFIGSAIKAIGKGVGKAAETLIENTIRPIAKVVETVSDVVSSVGSFVRSLF